MKAVIFATLFMGISFFCKAQKQETDTAQVKFKPPKVVKNTQAGKKEQAKIVRFTPPKVVKDKAAKPSKHKKVKKQNKQQKVKFSPPVIKKDVEQ